MTKKKRIDKIEDSILLLFEHITNVYKNLQEMQKVDETHSQALKNHSEAVNKIIEQFEKIREDINPVGETDIKNSKVKGYR